MECFPNLSLIDSQRNTNLSGVEVEMNWNIAHYLPRDQCQSLFHDVIARWIYRMCVLNMRARRPKGVTQSQPVSKTKLHAEVLPLFHDLHLCRKPSGGGVG